VKVKKFKIHFQLFLQKEHFMSKKLTASGDWNLDPQGSQEKSVWKQSSETVVKPFSHLPFFAKK
jgi:hypothetical protein